MITDKRFSMKKILSLVFRASIVLIVLYPASCSFISYKKNSAYKKINIGDQKENVIKLIGNYSKVDNLHDFYKKYSSQPCVAPCFQRLWFENPLGIDIQAWSVSLNIEGKVISKYHWVSP